MALQTDITLILGGVRSGKSAYGERLAKQSGKSLIYLATCEKSADKDMKSRIKTHQKRRGDEWALIEEPIAIVDMIDRHSAEDQLLFIDCLGLWLSNLILQEKDLDKDINLLVTAIGKAKGPVVLISNEVGLSLVPTTKLGRQFQDAQGQLNQKIAEIADQVILVTAGLPLILKGAPITSN